MPAKSPQQRSQVLVHRGACAAQQYDSRELTKNARAKFDERFLDEVDPDRTLPEAEVCVVPVMLAAPTSLVSP